MIVDVRYWDSNAFLGWLKPEEDKVEACRAVLKEAEAGRIRLVTSALTLVEVIKLRKRPPIEKEDAAKIEAFFKHSYISVRNVDRYVAETGRGLVWDYGVKPKDAIHVATCVRFHIPRLETFDGELIALNGQIGDPPLSIRKPGLAQPNLPFSGAADESTG